MFATRCPVEPTEQRWIEESMAWFRTEFGDRQLRGPVVTPTDTFFPGRHDGSVADIRQIVAVVCGYASVDPATITLEFYGDPAEAELASATGLTVRTRSAAGHYRSVDGRAVIGIDLVLGADPQRLIATVAHELGHVRLLGERRIDADRKDNEPLTDLLTVYLGLGICTANARFDYQQTTTRQSTRQLGYLTEPMFGYGLACYAWLRREQRPQWAAALDANPRAYCKRGLRYLAANAAPGAFPPPEPVTR
jgi:hypothetical protein